MPGEALEGWAAQASAGRLGARCSASNSGPAARQLGMTVASLIRIVEQDPLPSEAFEGQSVAGRSSSKRLGRDAKPIKLASG